MQVHNINSKLEHIEKVVMHAILSFFSSYNSTKLGFVEVVNE